MTHGPCVLGVDFGTESVRVGIFDLNGRPLTFASEPYPLYHPHPGWAEQKPDEWWQAFVVATRRALAQSNLSGDAIVGLGADCTSCTVVMMDETFTPLRPAIIWMDVRAADQANRIAQIDDPARKYNGFGNVSAEWMPCKALWVKENEPKTWAKARYVGEFIDWLTHRLTGEWVGSINNVSIRWYYDRNTGGWPVSFYEKIGLGDLIERFPPRILDMGQVAGTLRPDVAAELGLRPGIPVAEGGADAYVAMIGLDVVTPGKAAFITGSSHLILGQSATQFHARGIFGAYTDAVMPGQYTVEGGQVSTGSVVKWFRDNFCGKEATLAAQRGVDVYTVLNELAAQVPIGSDGLIVLDYWQGNRTPYVDPEARGIMRGFSLRHTTGHVFRAILEGICYGTEHILRTMRANGFEVKEVVAAGGPTKSRLWMQMHADVSNTPITLTEVPDAPALGSAILGAVAASLFPSVADAARQMVHGRDRIEPNADAHAEYRFYVDQYIATYGRLQDLIQETTRHVARRAR
ncbi:MULTISPECIES: FGGY-family carbohydrate kinase [Caldilinea]|uniref:FGGY-family carbohydrate kinase n=1 Tax=Caldilinea TaxID=233191 RepID=UPI00030DF784|nr:MULTISPECIES: FGGY family carbohydrate kinase [Caldilinea]GIV73339.1 MAG: carbohydrate kinase [Caldilinea sp.]